MFGVLAIAAYIQTEGVIQCAAVSRHQNPYIHRVVHRVDICRQSPNPYLTPPTQTPYNPT